jgi:hypothetical protein
MLCQHNLVSPQEPENKIVLGIALMMMIIYCVQECCKSQSDDKNYDIRLINELLVLAKMVMNSFNLLGYNAV